MADAFKQLEQQWKRRDDGNGALSRLVPEDFVRSRLVDHVSHDLAVGASGGWDVEDFTQYVTVQSETALRHLASNYPYDDYTAGATSLRTNADVVSASLQAELQER